jgi:indoleamine 2,3-dioxygenase
MSLPPNHFLALPRATFPDFRDQTYDTATVAAADYDVDVRTGFMPPRPPVARLDGDFEVWERTLDEALGKVKLAAGEVRSEEAAYAERWREIVRKVRFG